MTARRTDLNHAEIRDGLRALPGVSVHDLSQFPGCLDLLCGWRGQTFWLEIKQPGKRHALTLRESRIVRSWWGHVAIVETLEEAMAEIGWGDVEDDPWFKDHA